MFVSRGSRRARAAAVGTAALLAAGGLIMVGATSATAGAQTRYVALTGDNTDNDCTNIAQPCQTIQYAIDQANAGDTVSVKAGTYDESLHIRISLTLEGQGTTGSSKTTVDGFDGDTSIIIDGTDASTTPTVLIQSLDVSGNSDSGGIQVTNANVTVHNSAVNDNNNDGIDVAGPSQLTVTDSSVDGNGSDGVFLEPTVANTSSVKPADASSNPSATISNSDLSHNGDAGLDAQVSDVTVQSSTVNRNTFGGVFAEGGGTVTVLDTTLDHNGGLGLGAIDGATLHLDESTVSNTVSSPDSPPNEAPGVEGVFGATVTITQSTIYKSLGTGVVSAFADVEVRNSTVADTLAGNSSGELGIPAGALAVVTALPEARSLTHSMVASARSISPASEQPTTLTVRGTILADNVPVNCSAGVTDETYNLSDDASCAFSATGSKNSGNAHLGAFGLHGGQTDTLVPLKGSDAIDKIPSGTAGCSASAFDQRGQARLQGPRCDIGSVEAHQTPLVISPDSLPDATVNTAFRVALKASGGLGAPYEFSVAPGSHLPNGLSLSSSGVLSGTPTLAGTFTFTVSVDDPTLKTYTLKVNGGSGVLADTGTRVAPMVVSGSLAVVLGVLMMLSAGYLGRRRREQG